MDIQLTDSLLRDYLDTKATPQQIAEKLSLCGPTVDRLHQEDNDWVYDIEIITNRVDAASALGIAREASAILPEFNIDASLKPYNIKPIEKKITDSNVNPLDLTVINNPSLNHRILAIKIANVTISSSPQWMQERLEKMGQRPLNNIIDITNYVTFELGHPIHAFDYDRITTKKIIVREAKKGEKLTTLDEKTHTMRGGEVVYDDGTGNIIDLPGIMGTANSVVTNDTKNVLLWIEDNNGKKIRSASLIHQIRTHAAILNEKHVDPELAYTAIIRAAELMLDLAKGKIGSQILDIYPTPEKSTTVEFSLSWLKSFAGIDIPKQKIIDILTRLGFSIEEKSTDLLICKVPSWRRHDISIKEDVAEEITRVYGYFRLPSVLPVTEIPKVGTNPSLSYEMKIRQQMANLGFTEVYNSALISENQLALTHSNPESVFKLQNPLSEDFLYMRPSLIPSLIQNVLDNRGNLLPQLIFELSNVYHKIEHEILAHEQPSLAFAIVGLSYREAKGMLESLFEIFHLPLDLKPSPSTPFSEVKAGLIQTSGTTVGSFGYLDTNVIQSLHVPEFGIFAELNFELIASLAAKEHHFQPVSQTTPIIEDLTFTIPEKTLVGPVIESIKQVDALVNQVSLKTVYNQNFTFTIIYRVNDRTLSTEEVAPIRKQIVNQLQKQGILLVGEI